MLLNFLITAALLSLGFVAALPAENVVRCDVSLSDDERAAFEAQFQSDLLAAGPSLAPEATGDADLLPVSSTPPHTTSSIHPPPPPRKRRVKVHWHVIYASNHTNDGSLSNAAIQSSIKALNEHYSSTTFTFSLASTTHTKNANWFNNVAQGTALQTEMKNALHAGGAGSLNVYSVAFKNKGSLGYSTFPQSYNANKKNDGVVIRWDTVPGGTAANYNQGKTLSHEVGHWLGLYHPWGSNCSYDADGIADTPIQTGPTYGCPAFKDSCPNKPGFDSIHNYMAYTYDSCMHEFTPGQTMRMIQQASIYRGIQPS